ncbi:MAG TPA: zincin-like metallopeptidase domain-containing protein [Bryobacteraceae bacterium]|nr:zincin-like metallopeptidase domain-containing protein [Bryobacteraceae bacterium]
MTTEKQDVYTRITNTIVALLEKGVRPWVKPWSGEHASGRITRPLRHNGQPYSGINVLMLWASAVQQDFTAPIWMTFNHAADLNAHVRKGEKGSLIVYANRIKQTEQTHAGEEIEREIPFLKGYTVFNVEQIEGLPDSFHSRPQSTLTPVEQIARAEEFFANTGATIRYGGNRAYYAKEVDRIQMPPIEAFIDAETFYATLGHETAHWAGHPSRLARDFGRKAWGDEGYAREELVAELASAFLAADLELGPQIRDAHAAYIASWLTVLKNDKRAIFSAAAHAQRAVDFLHGLQRSHEEAA